MDGASDVESTQNEEGSWVDSENNLHRLDGPAITWATGTQDWCFLGHYMFDETLEVLQKNLTPTDMMNFHLAHPDLDPKNIEKVTGWNPNNKPTQHQLDTWQLLAGLTL